MSDLDRRWQRLVAASRRTPPHDVPPPSPTFMERVARRGLAARGDRVRHSDTRQPERWAWATLLTVVSVGALALLWARAPVQHEARTLAQEIARLPHRVPAAPELPEPFTLPPAREALALLPNGPALRSALGFPPLLEDTP